MFRRSQTAPLAADGASFVDGDDDDDDPLLTQPPSVLNIVRSPSSLADEQPPSFLDSVRRVIDNETEFTRRSTTEYVPPSPPSIVIPDYISAAIKTELLLTWQCKTPRPYQIEAIFHLVYSKMDMMYLIRKTGEGKSLVLNGMSSILKGVTISMVPLLGLGSDQAQKCRNANTTKTVEAYHLDEFCHKNASELRKQLNLFTRDEKITILLFVSPQQLSKHSYWYKVLLSLAERGCVSGVCVDEVHCTVNNYESFRPEFKTAIDCINELVGIARRNNSESFHVPILAMSATFTNTDQQSFNQLINRLPTIVMWGEMSRRNITFTVDVSGDAYNAFIKDWTVVMQRNPKQQSLVYSNSAAACDGSILNRLFAARRKVPSINGTFFSLTGECGMMLKSYLMASFCNESEDSQGIESTNHDAQPSITLPTIVCMPCTSAANCGVSSKNCTNCFRIGLPPSWHELVQEMGRVDRLHHSVRGANTYKVYLNMTTFISLWCRVQSEPNKQVQQRSMDDLMDLLRFLVLPTSCYHDAIEKHFENPSSYDSDPSCDGNCSFCDGSINNICGGAVSKSQIISLLTTHVFDKGSVPALSLISMLTSPTNKRRKAAIWRGKTNILPGHAHALILMLLASNIIHLQLPESSEQRTGFTPLRDVHAGLSKQFAHIDDDFETFSILIDSNWAGIVHVA